MRNSESAHLFTYNYFWKLVSISIISAFLFLHLHNPDKQTNKHTQQQLSFNNIDSCYSYRYYLFTTPTYQQPMLFAGRIRTVSRAHPGVCVGLIGGAICKSEIFSIMNLEIFKILSH